MATPREGDGPHQQGEENGDGQGGDPIGIGENMVCPPESSPTKEDEATDPDVEALGIVVTTKGDLYDAARRDVQEVGIHEDGGEDGVIGVMEQSNNAFQ